MAEGGVADQTGKKIRGAGGGGTGQSAVAQTCFALFSVEGNANRFGLGHLLGNKQIMSRHSTDAYNQLWLMKLPAVTHNIQHVR